MAHGAGDRVAPGQSLRFGTAGSVDEQDGVVHDQAQQNDESAHGQQIHRLEGEQVHQPERQHTAGKGQRHDRQDDQRTDGGSVHRGQDQQQNHQGVQQVAAHGGQRLIESIGAAAIANRTLGTQHREYGRLHLGFDRVDGLFEGGVFRRKHA